MEGCLSQKKNVPAKAICLQCGYTFHKTTALNDFCSPKCKRERKCQLRGPYERVKKEKPIKERPLKLVKKVEKAVLNERRTKSEAVLIENMIELNRNAPAHDREIIQKKKIVSPKLSEMPYRAHDKRLKITYYFRTEEKYNNYLYKQENEKSN